MIYIKIFIALGLLAMATSLLNRCDAEKKALETGEGCYFSETGINTPSVVFCVRKLQEVK